MAALTAMFLAIALNACLGDLAPDVSLLWMVPRPLTIKMIFLHEYGGATFKNSFEWLVVSKFSIVAINLSPK